MKRASVRLRTGACLSLLAWSACVPGAAGSPPPAPSASSAPSYRAQPPGQLGGTLVVADWEYPATFNPLAPATEAELRAIGLLFVPLWGLDASLNPYPDLVREVPTVENGMVKVAPGGKSMAVVIKLLPGLRWSDGAPLNADDVIFSWNALCDVAHGGAGRAGFDRVQAMERRSETELVWRFEAGPAGRCGGQVALESGAYGGYLQMGTQLRVIPAHRLQAVARADWERTFFARPDVVSGPFGLGDLVPGERVAFGANGSYAAGRAAPGAYTGRAGAGPFGHPPHLARILLRVYPSKDAMLAGLNGGEADLGFHLGAADLLGLRSLPGSSPLVEPGLRDEFLSPNHGPNTATRAPSPWVQPGGGDDAPVLQALSLAVDRQVLGRQAVGADVSVAASRGLFPSSMRSYVDASLPEPRADLEAARQLLDGDGWRPSGTDPVRSKAGRRLEFQLLGVCGSASSERELGYLKEAWAQVGASVRTGCGSRAQLFGSYQAGGIGAVGAFDMALFSNSWLPDPDAWASSAASGQIPSASLPGGQNWNRCQDPALDRDFAAGAANLAAGARRTAYLRAQKEWLAYHCTIPLFEWPLVRQVARQVHNFNPGPQAGLETWNAVDWWLAPG